MAVDWSGRSGDWVSVRQALDRVLRSVEPLPEETVELAAALGRVLAADAVSPVDQPPWDNSAMDGYAVRSDDIADASPERPIRLPVVDDIPAGGFPSRPLSGGEAARIMTGAPVPEGADGVTRVEHTDAGRDTVEIRDASDARRNIRRRGEDLARGDLAVRAGTAIGAAEMGVLASVGMARPRVHRRPVVAILSNGDELASLAEYDEVLAGRKIVNSNSYSLAGATAACGGVPRLLGIARDEARDIEARVGGGLDADLLVTTAGASVGEHDRIKDVLEALGLELDFWRVRMRPGSPASYGRISRAGRPPLHVFGLPGNPVSALVTFRVLVAPAVRRLQGRTDVHEAVIRVRAAEPIRSKPDKMHFQRVRLEPGRPLPLASLTGPQGSGILTSLTAADALLVIPEGARGLDADDEAVALPLGAPDRAAAVCGLPLDPEAGDAEHGRPGGRTGDVPPRTEQQPEPWNEYEHGR